MTAVADDGAEPAGSIAERALAHEPPKSGGKPNGERVTVWPDLLFREIIAALACLVVLLVISIVVDAPLEAPADAAHTPNPARAPWYFVGLQELLVYFDPWVAGVAIPLLIILGLCAIPYVDPTRHDQGVYTIRRRPLASAIFLTGLVGWFVLIAIGLWFRGPGWAWVWPGGNAMGGAAPETTRALPNWLGVPLVLVYFGLGGVWIVRRTESWPGFTRLRRWTFALLFLLMAGTLLKILLRVAFHVRSIVSFESLGLGI